MNSSRRLLTLFVCGTAVACVAACGVTSAPDEKIARQESGLCASTSECSPGLFCVLGICCSNPCGNALCGIASLGACDDGNPCTQNDSCSTGSCIGAPLSGAACGSGLICDDGDCTSGCWIDGARVDAGVREGCQLCDPGHSTVSWSYAVDAGCSDGNACSVGDRCDGTGACVSSAIINCATSEPCHAASTCDPQTGQCGADVVLPDGAPCGAADHACLAGACVRSCVIDGGVALAGALNPGNACEVCDPAVASTGWSPLDGTGCDDGDLCTLEQCVAGVCAVQTSVKCAPLDSCHVAGLCDPTTGLCDDPIADAGAPCDDGFACSTGDTCNAGQCHGNTASCECDADSDCPAAPSCHKHAQCRSHQCTYDVDDSLGCDDQNACTLGDRCSGGECIATGEVRCSDRVVCGVSVCDGSSGACVMKQMADGVSCDGGICLDGACSAPDAGVEVDAGAPGAPDAGFAPDAGVDALRPVNFVAVGCSSTGRGFSLLAWALMLLRRRRPF